MKSVLSKDTYTCGANYIHVGSILDEKPRVMCVFFSFDSDLEFFLSSHPVCTYSLPVSVDYDLLYLILINFM